MLCLIKICEERCLQTIYVWRYYEILIFFKNVICVFGGVTLFIPYFITSYSTTTVELQLNFSSCVRRGL